MSVFPLLPINIFFFMTPYALRDVIYVVHRFVYWPPIIICSLMAYLSAVRIIYAKNVISLHKSVQNALKVRFSPPLEDSANLVHKTVCLVCHKTPCNASTAFLHFIYQFKINFVLNAPMVARFALHKTCVSLALLVLH